MIDKNWFYVLLCGLSVPISLFMWLGNMAFSKFWNDSSDEPIVIPPTRWLFSTLAPVALMIIGLRRGSVNKSGAILGILFAFILSISNHAFLGCLMTFFFSSSYATKFRSQIKRKFEKDFKGGEGQRNWVQVLCNGGMATQLALLYLIDCGSGERPIDFVKEYHASWLGVAVLSAFACCNGDTWASELGSVLSKNNPYMITTCKRVPRGTNGGISLIGLLVSFLGGVLVGCSYYLTIFLTVPSNILLYGPPQWPLTLIAGFAGLFGSLIDSLLGATLQYTGIDMKGKIVDAPGMGVRHIGGRRILDNHSVNLISSIITGVVMPIVALKLWPLF